MAVRGEETKNRILDITEALVLKKGFSATSLDQILKEAGVTKGAFFHHFRSKADLARKLVQRFADDDFDMLKDFDRRADALADDPYQALIIFIKLFEEWLDGLAEPFAGCLFAVYVYENRTFDPKINEFVKDSFERWQGFYERKFAAVIAVRPPQIDITAHELAETIISILEGSFILARSYQEPGLIIRQSKLFRNYLKLLFEGD